MERIKVRADKNILCAEAKMIAKEKDDDTSTKNRV